MAIEIRSAEADEIGQLGLMGSYVYGGSFGDGADNTVSQGMQPEWTLCAFEAGRMVTSYAAFPFTVRANGGATAMAGVTTVGTLPEYRRQGLLRKITSQSFADMKERDQPLAGLWASQAAIYQRYGYSAIGPRRSYAIDTADIRLLAEPAAGYRVHRVDAEAAFDRIKGIYRAFADSRTCYIHRSRALWDNNALEQTPAGGPVYAALCEGPNGDLLGYAIYTLRANQVDHRARSQEIVVRDLAWLDTDAYRALWEFIGRHDLVGRVRWLNLPADDPAPELLAEPRMLHADDEDGIWLRIIDAAAALTARQYDVIGSIRIGIPEDPLAPWNGGAWELEVSPEGAHISPTKATPQVVIPIKALASLWSGARGARQLLNFGLIDGDADDVANAERIFATRFAPHCPDHF